MMYKKHYHMIAKVIRANYVTASDREQRAIRRLAYHLAEEFSDDNINFRKQVFLTACGVDNDQRN